MVVPSSGRLRRPTPIALRDFAVLTKPTITATNVLTFAGGYALTSAAPGLELGAGSLGIGLVVASANAFNMVIEADTDARMARTRGRPIPSGRISRAEGTVLATALGGLGTGVLSWLNPTTASIAFLSLVVYAFIYTPMKHATPWALLIGALPGAAPPLLGVTAATGRVGVVGLLLFALLFVWQLPHFLAIALLAREDYSAGGIPVVSVVCGARATRTLAFCSSLALVPTGLMLTWLGVAGPEFGAVSTVMAAGMAAFAAISIHSTTSRSWDRRLFFGSLVYLVAAILTLTVGALR